MKPQMTEAEKWQMYHRGARNRRLLVITSFSAFSFVSILLGSVLPLLLGEAMLWAGLKFYLHHQGNQNPEPSNFLED